MTTDPIGEILTQAITQPAFRDLLFRDPEQALAGYSLTDLEITRLRSFTPEMLYRLAGELLAYRVMPIRVGRRFVVVFSTQEYSPEPGRVPILLGPRLAFGGGLHETTQLCLAALEEVVRPGAAVFDLGTGTGILAIAAAKLGAASVLAVDTSPEAVAAASENVEMNGVAAVVCVAEGSLDRAMHPTGGAGPREFDVVVANLLAPIIREMMGHGLVRCLAPNAALILSGVRATEQAEIDLILPQAGLAKASVKQSGDWICLKTFPTERRPLAVEKPASNG